MHVFRAWRVGLVAGVLLTAGWALADEPAPTTGDPAPSIEYPECTRTPTEADLEGAKGAHRAAIQFYERADYERAIQYWRDAYEFDCSAHGVLINIASAYEKKGDRQRAVDTLEAYLSRAPDAPDAVTIQERVQNLRNALRAAQDPRPKPTAKATVAPPPEPPPPPPTTVMVRPYGSTPLVVAGAGGVALFAGAILVPTGLSAISTAEETCRGRVGCGQQVADEGNAGRTQATVGGVALGVGAAALAGGLIWHFLANDPVPQPAPVRRTAPPPAPQPDTPAATPQPGTSPAKPAKPAKPATPPPGSPPTPPPDSDPDSPFFTIPPTSAPPVPAPGSSLRVAPAVGVGYSGVSITGKF